MKLGNLRVLVVGRSGYSLNFDKRAELNEGTLGTRTHDVTRLCDDDESGDLGFD